MNTIPPLGIRGTPLQSELYRHLIIKESLQSRRSRSPRDDPSMNTDKGRMGIIYKNQMNREKTILITIQTHEKNNQTDKIVHS